MISYRPELTVWSCAVPRFLLDCRLVDEISDRAIRFLPFSRFGDFAG
ncbi:hypothetical protein BUC_5047 [Burkholderia pseudomallei 576]|nr:hypothetical protein BUC_5047 [Burkholderia pseudomallei 576]